MECIERLEVENASAIGQKGLRLRLLQRNGFFIPTTYVVGHRIQEAALAAIKSPEQNIRDRKELLPLWRDVNSVFEVDGYPSYVVRSSCSTEDLPFASAAGQYESFLNLNSPGDIFDAIIGCYRTITRPTIVRYLTRCGIEHTSQRMSVLIQRMLRPTIAGVLYTVAPDSEDHMLAEYVPGIGTAVVAGRGSPTCERIPRDGGIADALCAQLRTTGHRLEQLFEGPQDVEWGVCDGELVIFQSRNIVSVPPFRERFSIVPSSGRTSKARQLAPGVSAGRLVASSQLFQASGTEQNLCSKIVYLDSTASEEWVRQRSIGERGGIVTAGGGQLSHFASICRQFGIPFLRADIESISGLVGNVVVLDADNECITLGSALSPTVRKHVIFDWATGLAARRLDGVCGRRHLEAVIADDRAVKAAWDVRPIDIS